LVGEVKKLDGPRHMVAPGFIVREEVRSVGRMGRKRLRKTEEVWRRAAWLTLRTEMETWAGEWEWKGWVLLPMVMAQSMRAW